MAVCRSPSLFKLSISKLDLMIVDDDMLIRDILSKFSGKLGFNVAEQAKDGAEAVEVYIKRHKAKMLTKLQC